MRNILEATNTYKQRKTNSFSGKTVTNRHTLPCSNSTGNSSDLFSVAILSSWNNTSTYFNMASGYEAPSRRISCISAEHVNSRLTYAVGFTSYQYALKANTIKKYTNSGALTTCCRTHKNINNIDCTITPESMLNFEKGPVNQVATCTLGEVPVMPGYPTETSLLKYANGIRPAKRSLN